MSTSTTYPVSHCRSCGARIVWALTEKNMRMPVDAEASELGKLLLWRDEREQVRVRVISNINEGALTHRPHFATCPDSESWRKR